MFQLDKITRPMFEEMIDSWLRSKSGINHVWRAINDVKPVPVIPGINVLTFEQIADYFEVSSRGITKTAKEIARTPEGEIQTYWMTANMLKEFSLDWETVQVPEGRYIRINYPKFSIAVPTNGIECCAAIDIIRFIIHMTGSNMNSRLIEALIRRAATSTVVPHNADKLFDMLPNRKADRRTLDDEDIYKLFDEFIVYCKKNYQNSEDEKFTIGEVKDIHSFECIRFLHKGVEH